MLNFLIVINTDSFIFMAKWNDDDDDGEVIAKEEARWWWWSDS